MFLAYNHMKKKFYIYVQNYRIDDIIHPMVCVFPIGDMWGEYRYKSYHNS